MVGMNPELASSLEGLVLADRYRLVRILGSGAMGRVYEAEQLEFGRSVAVKVIREGLASDAIYLERFRTEALAASRINHPNAVAIYDFGVTSDGRPFLVMERLRGRPLGDLVAEAPLSPHRTATIGLQVLAALDEAHACHVVHRDLKSDNIIAEPLRDGSDLVKVLDFGLAHLEDRPTDEHGVSGTPEYMAPEQIRGEPVTPAIDLYAAGVVLYELLVGRTPFAGPSVPQILARHLEEAPSPPEAAARGCPASLSRLILRALEKDPARRHPSAAAMRAALQEVLPDTLSSVQFCPDCGARRQGTGRICPACGREDTPPPRPGARVTLGLTPRPQKAPSIPRLVGTRSRQSAPVVAGAPLATPRGTGTLPPPRDLVGREPEAARLTRFLARGDGAAAIALVGPEGSGKGHLMLTVARRQAASLVSFVAGPDPSGNQLPWYPMLSMVRAILSVGAKPTLDELSIAVARAGLPERDLPGLALLLGLPSGLDLLEHAVRRRETFSAVHRTLRTVTRRFARTALCFHDVDRFDSASRRILEALAAGDPSGPRILVTCRTVAAAPPGAEVLELPPLSSAEARQLLERLDDRPGAERPPADALVLAAGGLPGAVEQLAAWLALGRPLEDAPHRLADLVAARLASLPGPERRVLQEVAVFGQVALRALLDPALAAIDPSGGARERLVRGGLLEIDPLELTIPQPEVAELAAECTPTEVRRGLAGRALEHLRPTETPPAIRAHLAEVADRPRLAAELGLAAGDDAVRRFDDEGAARWYGRAMAAARRLDAAGDPTAGASMVAAALRLADVLRYTGQLGLATGCLDEAERLDPAGEGRAAVARARGRIALAAGDAAAATPLLREAIGLALRAGDREILCDAYVDLASAHVRLGDPAAAIAELGEAVDVLTHGEGLPSGLGPSRLLLVGLRLAELHLRSCARDRARAVALDTLARARREHATLSEGRVHAQLAAILSEDGDEWGALEHRNLALEKLRALGDRWSTAELLVAHARASASPAPSVPPARRTARGIPATPEEALGLARLLAAEVRGWHPGASAAAADLD